MTTLHQSILSELRQAEVLTTTEIAEARGRVCKRLLTPCRR